MIRAESLSVEFSSNKNKNRLTALNDINFTIHEGEFIALLGPSGCGKSTLINTVAGFVPATKGKILYKDQEIKKASSERVVIFQNYALFPWKSAIENITFSLKARGVSAKDLLPQALEYLKLVRLEEFASHFPKELSGGMQQRIGIARALAADPEVLLLDEPFASLDQFTRDYVLSELLKIIRPMKKTAILVTHNVNEALFFADRIFIMSGKPGRLNSIIDINEKKPTAIADIDDSEELRKKKKEINLLLGITGEQK